MRKLISILLIVGFVFAFVSPSYAILNRFNQDQEVKMWTVTNAKSVAGGAATGQLTSLCPTTKIYPGANRILGFSITAIAGAGEGFAGIYDADSLADINESTNASYPSALEAEAEIPSWSNNGYVEVWFPYPYEVTQGIAVIQGANTAVTVYYEDYRR